MPGDPTQHTLDTSSLAEGGLEIEDYPSIDQFNQVFRDRMVKAALSRWKNLTGASEREIVGAVDIQETAYRNAFTRFWEKKGIPVDPQAAELAWKKARKAAIDQYSEIAKNSNVTKAVPTKIDAPARARPAAPQPPTIPENMRINRWSEWNAVSLDEETLGRFTAEFVPELGKALGQLSRDPRERAAQLNTIKGVYVSVTYRMYENAHPDFDKKVLQEEFQKILPSYWRNTLGAAQQFMPVT